MDKYYKKYGELYCEQLELELAYKEEAEELLKASTAHSIVHGEASQTKVGGKLVDHAYETVAANMRALIESVRIPQRGVVAAYAPILNQLLEIYREREEDLITLLALSGLGTTLSSIFLGRNTLSGIAKGIVSEVQEEAKVEAFFHFKAQKEGKADPKLWKNFDEGIKKRVGKGYKATYAAARMRKESFTWTKWPRDTQEVFGAKLLEMVIKGSGYFNEVVQHVSGAPKPIACIAPKQWLIDTWNQNTELLTKYAFKYCPMVIPPRPWMSPWEGGYYGELTKFVTCLRLSDMKSDNVFSKEYLARLDQVDLSYVYSALNAMQATPFKINRNILEISEKILASGGGLGFPRTEPIPQLPDLVGEFTEEELKEHKRKKAGIIKQNLARASKALRATMSVSTARKFTKYDKIYFPWNLDYRGRCYPVPSSLSPQGDDITKALLLFAEPEACKNPDDDKWLAIHGANLAGRDKLPFEERITWVKQHTKEILSSAQDPLVSTWWYEEAKGDYPLEFLAFCYEWQRLQEWLKEHENCIGFKSGLAIAFDGTCSGLQHFSAMLCDEIGGRAVNLIPSDQVQDIYNVVAQKVNLVLIKDAMSGTPDDYKRDKEGKQVLTEDKKPVMQLGTKTLAQQWLLYAREKFGTEGITRKVVKRSVMTLAYGSKKFGFKNNILEDIIKPYILAHPDDHPFQIKDQAALYMAELTWAAVSKTVVKAVKGMDYLQKIAGEICKAGAVVTWTTPNGLPIQQNYFKMEQKVFKMRFNGTIKRFYTQENTFQIDKTAQKNAISPNFIHSLDACHLQRVVVESYAQGNRNFAMIHDSFGTDMAGAEALFKTIRQEFVKLYDKQDHLQNFVEDVTYLMPEGAELPEKPKKGKLNVQAILHSDYCFA